MAKTNVRKAFTGAIKGKAYGLKCKAGKREDGKSSFHDTFTCSGSMTYEEMHQLLDSMGMSNTTFVDDLPDEAPTIFLQSLSFSNQELKIRTGGQIHVFMDDVSVTDVVVHKESDSAFKLVIKVKGIPPLDQHFKIEEIILDCHDDHKFMFEFGTPPQVEMDMGEDETAGQTAEPANVA